MQGEQSSSLTTQGREGLPTSSQSLVSPESPANVKAIGEFYKATPKKLDTIKQMMASGDNYMRDIGKAWMTALISGPKGKDEYLVVGNNLFHVPTQQWIRTPQKASMDVTHLKPGINLITYTDEQGNRQTIPFEVDEPGNWQLTKVEAGKGPHGESVYQWYATNPETSLGRPVLKEDGSPLMAGGNVTFQGEIPKSTYGDWLKKMADAQLNLGRMEYMQELMPAMLEAGTLSGRALLKIKDLGSLIGFEPSEGDKYWTMKEARTVARDISNRYIKFITGAQMSEREAQRLLDAIPNPKDSPAAFRAKFNAALKLSQLTYNFWYDLVQKYQGEGMAFEEAAKKAQDDSAEFVKTQIDEFEFEGEGLM
jgi:hypothetical protein